MVDAIADQIATLRKDGHDDDLELMKLQAKTLISYCSDFDSTVGYELQPFIQRIEKAKALVQELADKHSHTKYKVHIDYIELAVLHPTISIA